MPAAGFHVRHRQLGVALASAVSVVAMVAAVALAVHPGRDTAARSPAARDPRPAADDTVGQHPHLGREGRRQDR